MGSVDLCVYFYRLKNINIVEYFHCVWSHQATVHTQDPRVKFMRMNTLNKMRSAHQQTFWNNNRGRKRKPTNALYPAAILLIKVNWNTERERKVNFFLYFVSTRLHFRCNQNNSFLLACTLPSDIFCRLWVIPAITMDFWNAFKKNTHTKYIRLFHSCNKCRCLHILGHNHWKTALICMRNRKWKRPNKALHWK